MCVCMCGGGGDVGACVEGWGGCVEGGVCVCACVEGVRWGRVHVCQWRWKCIRYIHSHSDSPCTTRINLTFEN